MWFDPLKIISYAYRFNSKRVQPLLFDIYYKTVFNLFRVKTEPVGAKSNMRDNWTKGKSS